MDPKHEALEWLRALSETIAGQKRLIQPIGRWEALRRELLRLIDDVQAADNHAQWEELRDRIGELTARYPLDPLGRESHWSPTFRSTAPEALRQRPAPIQGPVMFGEDETTSMPQVITSLQSELGAPTKHIDAYPDVRMPERVVEDTAFRIEVAIRKDPTEHAAEAIALKIEGFQSDQVDIDIEISLPPGGGLEARTQVVAPLRITPGKDSVTIAFEIKARALGAYDVGIIFRQGAIETSVLTRRVLVCKPEELGSAKEAAPIKASSGGALSISARPERALVLNIQRSGSAAGNDYFDVCLRGDYTLIPASISGIIQLSQGTQERVSALCIDLFGCIKHPDPEVREARIRAIGQRLGENLLPEPIRRFLGRDALDAGTPLHIESEDAWVPWEMLAIPRGRQPVFLGEQFALTRWLRSGSIRLELCGDDAVLIAPETTGFAIDRERNALAALMGGSSRVREICRMREVQECFALDTKVCGFFHFACHGKAMLDSPLGARLLLDDGELQPVDVPRLAEGNSTSAIANACVFLNACEAGTPGRELFRFAGWADAFLEAGAAAVIAPSWQIQDRAAVPFAERFYQELSYSTSVGEAARRARVAIYERGYPDWLAHAVYAAPGARLVRPPATLSAA